MSDHKPDRRPMVQFGADPVVKEMIARMDARAAAFAQIHEERMANLPAGTCSRCYGVGYLNDDPRQACHDCNPKQFHAIGVPYEFHSATLATFEARQGNQAALAAAHAFFNGDKDLYLTGGVGAGKTRLACSIANDAKRRGRGGHFERVPVMLHRLQPSQAEDIREFERLLWTTPLLILDDVGAERDTATDYTRRTMLMLYEERCDRRLRTVWTSNKSINELGAMQDDDRLASRIAGRSDVVRLTTPDQRMLRRVR